MKIGHLYNGNYYSTFQLGSLKFRSKKSIFSPEGNYWALNRGGSFLVGGGGVSPYFLAQILPYPHESSGHSTTKRRKLWTWYSCDRLHPTPQVVTYQVRNFEFREILEALSIQHWWQSRLNDTDWQTSEFAHLYADLVSQMRMRLLNSHGQLLFNLTSPWLFHRAYLEIEQQNFK